MNIEDAAKPVPYTGQLTSHPFAGIVRDYLRTINIESDEIQRQTPNEIVWSYCANGVSAAYRLYKDDSQEVFAHVECAYGFLPKGCEDLIALKLLQENYYHYYPFWHAINEDGLAVLQFRCYVAGITESHFLLRLDTIVKQGIECRKVFLNSNYGLQPLPKSWFNKLEHSA